MKYVKYIGCIDSYLVSEGFSEPLSIGKTYKVLEESFTKGYSYYKVIDNYNEVRNYPTNNFVEVSREEKLRRILKCI